jgi:hypothetical protein
VRNFLDVTISYFSLTSQITFVTGKEMPAPVIIQPASVSRHKAEDSERCSSSLQFPEQKINSRKRGGKLKEMERESGEITVQKRWDKNIAGNDRIGQYSTDEESG